MKNKNKIIKNKTKIFFSRVNNSISIILYKNKFINNKINYKWNNNNNNNYKQMKIKIKKLFIIKIKTYKIKKIKFIKN